MFTLCPRMTGTIDFFISYRGARTDWARWINWVVRSAGFSTVLMDECPVGTTWTAQMRKAADDCRRLMPLYSADYWQSGACTEEFDAYWRQHLADNTARYLLPLGVEPCTVPVMHAMLLRRDLYKLDRDAAYDAILTVLKGIAPFGAAASFTDSEPPFPGLTAPPSAPADWPDIAPSLRWPMADHSEARESFAALITRGVSYQLLAIHGVSETGKSHLTRSFLKSALKFLPNCRCGRFDFRGTSDVEGGLTSFVQHLNVPAPAAGTLAARLSTILDALARNAQPTLLIFDTYELAGEADRWVRETLLTRLIRAPWLRIVTAGQSHPGSDDDARIIRLTEPSLDDWLAFALESKKPATLDFVREAHALCGGSAAVLAKLLGPAA